MSTEATNTNLSVDDESHFKPGALADAAIEAEVSHVNPNAESDSQANLATDGGVDNAPLTRAQRRAAQFNKGGNSSSGPRPPFAGGRSQSAPGATGADRVAPIPTKHAGRGK